MHFTSYRLPYEKTGYFSRLITDYLKGSDFLKSFYAHPVSVEGLQAAIHAREQFPTRRDLLVEVLREQYADQCPEPAVDANILSLLQPNSFTITTAHQPAIFTGNLYFVYKILHVIKIASDLSARFPDKKFVPVFFMGSEDADLEELGHIYLDREKISWNTNQQGAVGRMGTDGLGDILTRIENEFSAAPYGPELCELLRTSYLDSDTVQTATRKLLHRLFGAYGLVVLIADDPRLKRQMQPVFRDDLFRRLPFQITGKTINDLTAQYPVQANPREINLFYLKDDIRERIEWKDDRYKVLNTSISFTPESLEQELEQFPERFSPNVILRGLYQETILPGIAFIGGGGEAAYWLELKSLFDHYKVPYPVVVLRNSFLLIRKSWRMKMEKSGLTYETIFKKSEKLLEENVRSHSAHQLSLAKEIGQLNAYYDALRNISETVDETLAPHVESLRSKALKGVEELEKKLLRAEKRNFADAAAKIAEVRSALFPLDGLQERVENFIPWYAAFGKGFLDIIYEQSLTLEGEFVLLEED